MNVDRMGLQLWPLPALLPPLALPAPHARTGSQMTGPRILATGERVPLSPVLIQTKTLPIIFVCVLPCSEEVVRCRAPNARMPLSPPCDNGLRTD